MASSYTSTLTIKSSGRYARGYVEAWVSSETDTTATIYWRILCQQKSAALYGQEAYGYVDGGYVGYASGYISSSSSSWKDVCSKSGYTTVNKTSGARSVPVKISTRVTPIDGIGSVTTGWAEATCYVSISGITYYEPNAPSGLTNTRSSDTKNVLAWTKPSTSTTEPVTAQLIERSVDGGSWSQIASVSGTATSYNDTTTTADHSYAYRIRSQNSAGYSGYVTSGTTYNTPSAPAGVTASRLAETTVKLEIANAANTATALEIQRSTDGDAWEAVATIEGAPVTEATDEPGGGTFYYRARNTRGELVSDWSPVSNAVVTICAPSAPTLIAPASGVVVNKAQETIAFVHAHNPIDGSGQRAAQYRFSTDKGTTYDYIDIEGDAQKLEVENTFAVNAEVTYGVRTKGAHEDWGPWSDNRVFYVYQAPSVAFAQPTDGFVVENTPIHVALQYGDASGVLANAMLLISDETRTVYTRNMGTATECDILATEWLPDSGKVYTLTVQVRSSSSLYASATREISVDFVLPQPAGIYIENDSETGYASIVVYVEEAADLEAPESISIWRESEDGRVLIAEGLQAGAGVVDMYAPLNIGYRYIVTTFADSGAANSTTFDNQFDTLWAFLYFADGGIARGKWNPEDSWKLNQEVDYVRYIGREHPVAYMRDAMEETHDVTVTLMDREEAREFRKMMAAHEPVVAKLWDSLVFHAVPQVQGKPKSTVKSYWGEVAVSLTRIDGEAL